MIELYVNWMDTFMAALPVLLRERERERQTDREKERERFPIINKSSSTKKRKEEDIVSWIQKCVVQLYTSFGMTYSDVLILLQMST